MMNPDYTDKTVKEWMDEMAEGELALTDFQRSRVWDDGRTARLSESCPEGTNNRDYIVGRKGS